MDDRSVILGSKLALYRSAQDLVKSKLILVKNKFESLEYSTKEDSRLGDIAAINTRVKDDDSIKGKLIKNGHEINYDNAIKYVRDIVGFRIICMYERDIYTIVNMIRKLGYTIVREKDYVSNPKPSGYRSYHLTVNVPIDFEEESVLVEIQIRTDFMNLWAEREHEMIYKNELDGEETINYEDLSEQDIKDLHDIKNSLISLAGTLNIAQTAMETARVKELSLKEKKLK